MIGIRREDKNQWERRAPLTPDHVASLVESHGVRFTVQPSNRRAFDDRDYVRAGAAVDEDLSGCDLILGVKEIPPEQFRPGTTYLFFSHTTKGQAKNMPALRRLMELEGTLLDYEQVADEHGRRLIFFGKHAGYAGMIDALWALGKRLEAEGTMTPFEQVRLAHEYSGLDEATHHISRLGERLRHSGLPDSLRPLVVGFTGSGNVAEGSQEIFDRLPTQELLPEELPHLRADPDRPRNLLYKVAFQRKHRVVRSGGGRFDAEEFAAHPDRYENGIARWLPYLTMFVHGSFWSPRQPRLISLADLRRMWASEPAPRLRVIADISCDIGGGIECTVRATTPGSPAFVYDLDRNAARDGVRGNGPVVLAVDNLPCQLPIESSQHFGDGLSRFIPALTRCDWDRPFDTLDLPLSLHRAVIVHRGRLAPDFSYLERSVREHG